MKKCGYILFLLLISFGVSSVQADSAEFPGRDLYPTTDYIELSDLRQKMTLDSAVVVDVRSTYEFDTLHINNALNIPYTSSTFVEDMQALRQQHPDKMIVTYCNGHTCMKSYKAAMKATKAGIENVVAFDAGIFEFSKNHPKDAVLLDEVLHTPARLISKDKLKAHMLSISAFDAKVVEMDSFVVDVRDKHQRDYQSLYMARDRRAPLGNYQKLDRYIRMAKAEGKPLLIYDQAGKQVRWLQYYLEAKGVQDYYFLEGGAYSYFKQLHAENQREMLNAQPREMVVSNYPKKTTEAKGVVQ